MSDLSPAQQMQLQRIREEERARIARDLHDELGGQLVGIGMALGQLRQQLLQHGGLPAALAQADYAGQLLQQAHQGMHALIDDLRPPIVESGLVEALAWQCRQVARQSGLECTFTCLHRPKAEENEFLVLSLLRIVREALSNALRHAGASRLGVQLDSDGARLLLSIADDGCGFDAGRQTAAGAGHGLGNMRQRALALGGELQLQSRPGAGTVVEVRLPVPVAP